jgi:hypothetical protein
VGGSRDRGDEPSDSINCWEILDLTVEPAASQEALCSMLLVT